jgi:anthranilate synthase/aminodeoxychorismate synthase-like glutamine amidotransferase
MSHVVIIDNYDSFTYNLVQYVQVLGHATTVIRNDEKSVDELIRLRPKWFIVSPGPSDPDHAGVTLELIGRCKSEDIPLFGVCLGMQAMAQAFGGKVVRAPVPIHGKVSAIEHKGQGVFQGLPSPLQATRYHSLIAEKSSLPACFDVTATADGLVMGLRLKGKPIEGVQFHPESILTEYGLEMLKNFFKY